MEEVASKLEFRKMIKGGINMNNRRLTVQFFSISSFVLLFIIIPNVFAGSVALEGDEGNASYLVDNSGGSQAYNATRWYGNNFVATINLAVFDALSQDIDTIYSAAYKGGATQDDNWANNQSGIEAYSAPVAGMPVCVGDVAARDGGDPSVPVRFEGANTGLTVEQFVYTGANDPFMIHEYKIINNTDAQKDIKVAHFNDFDVYSNPNDDMGYDENNKLVWQWDEENGGYIAGTALMRRTVSNWFLENCCTMTWGDYADQLGFFTDDPAFNGDKDTEPDDLEVDIATNVGTLQPGESATVAFVVATASGDTSATSLTNLQATIAAANSCYNAIIPAVSGDLDGNGSVSKSDLNILMSSLGKSVADCLACDLNHDGDVDISDLRQLIAENPSLARDRQTRRTVRTRSRRSRR